MSVLKFRMPPYAHELWGGAPVWIAQDQSNWYYVIGIFVRHGPKPSGYEDFGTYCYRVNPENTHAEWVELPQFHSGRPGFHIELDGRGIISYPADGGKTPTRVVVPGFKAKFATDNPNPPVPNPTPLPDPVEPKECLDEGARKYTHEVKQELHARIDKVESRIGNSGGGLTEDQVNDVIWNSGKVVDRVWVELNNRRSGLAGQVRDIAREAVPSNPSPGPSPVDRDELKDLLRELIPEIMLELWSS